MMERSELNKITWREAATGGLYTGVGYAVLMIGAYLIQAQTQSQTALSQTIEVVNFFLLAGLLYYFAVRVRRHYEAAGEFFTFGRSWLFVLRMTLFTGVVVGMGTYILATWIDPQYVERMVNEMVNGYIQHGGNAELYREAGQTAARMMRSPLFMVAGGVFGMVIYGGLLGVVVSMFARSKRVNIL